MQGGGHTFMYKAKKTKLLLFFMILTLVSQVCQGAVLIFDLGQVLVKNSTLALLKNIGFFNFVGIYNPLTLEKKLLEFLSTLSNVSHVQHPLSLYRGYLMPVIMQDWLCGYITSDEVLQLIEKNIDKHPELFNWPTEKKLVYEISKIIFTPELFIETVHPIKAALKLLDKVAQQKDAFGNKLHRIYVLSNWDKESFEYLCKKYDCQKLLSFADGIMISGYQGKMKPDPDIYIDLFNSFKIDPYKELTVYVDDDLANLQAAIRLNPSIKTIHCQRCDLKAVKREFKKLGIIS